jgi:dienelactone hydrolase
MILRRAKVRVETQGFPPVFAPAPLRHRLSASTTRRFPRFSLNCSQAQFGLCVALAVAFTVVASVAPASAAEPAPHSPNELRVLDDDTLPVPAKWLLREDLRRQAGEALDRRHERYEALQTLDDCRAYQRRLKTFFIEQLGGFPQRTPLNARIVGRIQRDDFRIEKVIYESRPGFHVTALLYLPDAQPPFPGVLMPCGHSDNGKAANAYQRACILLARNGLAVLCFDPIGQGERKQLLNDAGGGRYSSTGEHMVTGVAPILLGRNLATDMIWDGIRGLDYLQSRDDIDSARLGCTGNSGGGNMTSFLMALDERIVAAVPGCFVTTHRLKNVSPGPGDAEQNIHGQIAFGMDHADFLLMRAPQPTLIAAATRDYVPIEGAWEAYREAKRFYGRFGHPERVGLVETDARHGFSPLLRLGAARWMRQWLLDRPDVIEENDPVLLSDAEALCTPEGQVLRLDGARSIFDLNREYEANLKVEREQRWNRDPQAALSQTRKLVGVAPLSEIQPPRAARAGHIQRPGYRIEKLILTPSTGVVLPALKFEPAQATGDVVLYIHGVGKHVHAEPDGSIEKLVRQGHTVLAVDVRGCGETETPAWRYGRMESVLGHNSAEFFVAYMLGRSLVGLRTEDILACAQYLKRENPARSVHLVGVGVCGVPALHAAAFEPELFASLTLRQSLHSWRSVIETPVTSRQLVNAVHGALRVYDVQDLLSVLPKMNVTIEDPLDAAGRPLATGAPR